ncbi:FLO9-like protein [Fusarium coicis]|nr:FLO9-like protein [Fusarium coicis]
MHLAIGAALGLVGSVFAAPAPEACTGDRTDVVLQPYEIVHNGETSTTTITRTYTSNSWYAQTSVPAQRYNPGNSGPPASPGVPNPCIDCITITTTGSVPYVTTVPPATEGDKTTVISCIGSGSGSQSGGSDSIPVCHGCAIVTITGPTPWASTVPPASAGGRTTVFTCPGRKTITLTGTVLSTTTITPPSDCNDCSATVVIPTTVTDIKTVTAPAGLVTTITTAGTATGLTTLPATNGGTTTVVTFVTPGGGLTTETSTASTTGLTTLPSGK